MQASNIPQIDIYSDYSHMLLNIQLLQRFICWENLFGYASVDISYLFKTVILQRGLVKMPVQGEYLATYRVIRFSIINIQ